VHHHHTGTWFLLGYDEVTHGLADVRRDEHNSRDPMNPFMMDGPGHTRPRRLITPGLTNRAVRHLHERTQQIVDDALADKRPGDALRLVEEIGYPLPYRLMCTLMGIPELDDVLELRDLTLQGLNLIDAFLTPERRRACTAAAAELYAHIDEVVAWKRDHLADDLVSTVLRAADVGEVMQPEHVFPYLYTLYLAGMHTTVNQTSLSVLALMRHRAQWELLGARPELVEDAVEELLRYDSTAQYMIRTALEDLEIAGTAIPTGDVMVAWIASADRDGAKWGPTADTLDITRRDARNHVAFGKGAHVCVGSWLARLELRVVLATLVERWPAMEVAPQELTWTNSTTAIRGPDELVLTLAR
jgi:cytochrome P450